MPNFHKQFSTRALATAWAADCVAALQAKYRAAAALANPSLPSAAAVGGFSAKFVILAVEDLPSSAPGQEPFVRCKVLVESVTGKRKLSHLQFRKKDLPPLPLLGGFAEVSKVVSSTAEFRARLPKRVQYQTTAAAALGAGLQLEDRRTGKLYQTTGAATGAGTTGAGIAGIDVIELDGSVAGDVTFGSQLAWSTPPPNCLQAATVFQMLGTGAALSPNLVDPATGATYATLAAFTLDGSADFRTTGFLSTTAWIVQVAPPLGSKIPTNALTPNGVLQIVSPNTRIVGSAIVRVLSRPVIPAGASLTYDDGAGKIWPFVSTADTTPDDLATVVVPFKSLFSGAGPAAAQATPPPNQFTSGSTTPFVAPSFMTLTTPPAGLSSLAVVDSLVGAQGYPQPLGSASWGDEIQWGTHVKRADDGHYAATVFSLPAGS